MAIALGQLFGGDERSQVNAAANPVRTPVLFRQVGCSTRMHQAMSLANEKQALTIRPPVVASTSALCCKLCMLDRSGRMYRTIRTEYRSVNVDQS
jgi:hypothetical protein